MRYFSQASLLDRAALALLGAMTLLPLVPYISG